MILKSKLFFLFIPILLVFSSCVSEESFAPNEEKLIPAPSLKISQNPFQGPGDPCPTPDDYECNGSQNEHGNAIAAIFGNFFNGFDTDPGIMDNILNCPYLIPTAHCERECDNITKHRTVPGINLCPGDLCVEGIISSEEITAFASSIESFILSDAPNCGFVTMVPIKIIVRAQWDFNTDCFKIRTLVTYMYPCQEEHDITID